MFPVLDRPLGTRVRVGKLTDHVAQESVTFYRSAFPGKVGVQTNPTQPMTPSTTFAGKASR
jgi:hypothetical protein